MKMVSLSEKDQISLGEQIGALLKGGEFIELNGDIGSGKTTFVKGLAKGLEILDEVQSPSFTISRFYEGGRGIYLHHYDFYRLDDPGIMRNDLNEAASESDSVVAVEWSGVVEGFLPVKRIKIEIIHLEEGREIELSGLDDFPYIKEGLTK